MKNLPRLLRIPWRPSKVDVDDELRFHIDMAAADLVAAGLPPDQARAEATRRFGHLRDIRDAVLTIDERRRRGAARADFMTALIQDVRYALRAIGKTPMLTAATTITLMLGVGATTAMFSVVNGVLLRPLPYASAERLVLLADDQAQSKGVPFSFPEFIDWKQRGSDVFETIGAWWHTSLTLTTGPEPAILTGVRMSSSVPAMLGVRPILGRTFTAEDDAVGGPRRIMLSVDLWRRRFNADSAIVGRVIQAAGYSFTVIGVFPDGPQSRLPTELTNDRGADFWIGLQMDETRGPRGLHFISMMARVKPTLTPLALKAGIDRVNDQLNRDSVTTHRLAAEDLSTRVIGPSRKMLTSVFAAVVLVLLVACANVANLMLARASGRQREVAIRAALGAGRGRIMSQLLVESVVRAVLGGVLGVALAYAAVGGFRRMPGINVPRFSETTIDWRVMLFALAVSVATGIAFGIVPALRATVSNVGTVMRDGARGIAGSLRRDAFRRVLIVGELVMSFVLLGCAGLLLRSFDRLVSVPKGFSPERVVTGSINLPMTRYADSVSRVAFWNQLLARVRAIPGVTHASVTSNIPLLGGASGDIIIPGRDYPAGTAPIVEKRYASAGYFPTIGARFVSGRDFTPADAYGSQGVAIINEAFAKKVFPGENPIGKRVDFAWGTSGEQTIVGVVADVREGALNTDIAPAVYVPVTQRASEFMYLIVRTSVDEMSLVPALRRSLRETDALVPLGQVRSLEEVISSRVVTERVITSLVLLFAALTLILAGIGLYGVISYSVSQRTQELGIRAALGAQRSELLGGVFREGMGFAIVGIGIGAIAARGASQLISSQLFGVSAGDLLVFLVVGAVLTTVACAALLAPAVRASRVDPIVALRED